MSQPSTSALSQTALARDAHVHHQEVKVASVRLGRSAHRGQVLTVTSQTRFTNQT